MTAVEQDQPFSPLVAALVTGLHNQSRETVDELLALQKAQIEDFEAELFAIKHGISLLLAGPYMPMPDAIRRAVFYPDQKLIDEYKANKEVGW